MAESTAQQVFGGVAEGLRHKQGIWLALATGKSRVGLDRALEEWNLSELFTASRCAEESRSKLNPQMLEEILDYTSIDAHKALMVGDTTFDMDMARFAGEPALGVSYGVHIKEALLASGALHLASGALHVVGSFAQVLDWLGEGRLQSPFGKQ